MTLPDLVSHLASAGIGRGDLVGLAIGPDGTAGVAWAGGRLAMPSEETSGAIGASDTTVRPRWVQWNQSTAAELVARGVRLATAWDVAAVHRLLFGGWRADPALVWARLHDLPADTIPTPGPVNLFSQADPDDPDPDGPLRPDGHLRPEWTDGGWAESSEHLARWAELALEAAQRQQGLLDDLAERPRAHSTARSESAAELLCAELAADGLPLDRAVAERIVAEVVGPRPRTEAEAAAGRAERDALVLQHVPDSRFDLRSPGQVKSLLRRVGIEVPDTRAWRLEPLRDTHPVVEALLVWRKAERVATTYGFGWLDEHVGADGRLHGEWSASDGAAGRMTASSGLHNMPADLRGAVLAEPGHVFVRADLGQIEPRVLAAVSGDRAFAAATQEDDLYTPVATALATDRPTAKVAVLGAMYGQTTGRGAQVLPRLKAAYPVAMALLDDADRAAQVGTDLRTYGGRLVRMGGGGDQRASERELRSRAGARGRFGRNAMIQGAAAELFKVWAVTVRARAAAFDARIVLCLHDELLVHVPAAHGDEVAALLDACLQEAAHRWAPNDSVRFVADIGIVTCWADSKG